MEYLGNKDILKHHKTAFLSSRKCPAEVVLKSYDWAKEQREKGNCIVCGNHSQIEKDVVEILLKGTQPLIMVLARGMKKVWLQNIREAIAANRLLIISPFSSEESRVTRYLAKRRNECIISISNKIMIAYKTPGGQLDEILSEKTHEIL